MAIAPVRSTSLQRQLRLLGIETSCDETAAAVVERRPDGTGIIRSNIVRSQLSEHAAFGGVVPEIAARAHVEVLDGLIAAALADAGLALDQIDGVAAAAGPGLIGGLIVGLTTAKALALALAKPLLAVNHLEAHALTPGLTDGLRPPYLLLLVSGGHTQLVIVRDVGRYERLGTTLDDALGEAFDKTAKMLGLGYPGGPAVEQLAREGNAGRFEFPRPMLGRPDPHFSFAGLKTAVRQTIGCLGSPSRQDAADLCASFEAAVAASVIDRVRRAMVLYHTRVPNAPKRFTVAGGVAANARLRAALQTLAADEGYTMATPPSALCADNAAMIAWAGAERLARGRADGLDTVPRARWPLDEESASVLGAGKLGAKA